MKIGHISDIHWLDTTNAHFSDFLNKRISGGINLLAGRAKKHSKETTECALQKLKDLGCEHLVVTGDLSNLALPAEFQSVKHVLNQYFPDNSMTVVPGNHDFYTRESQIARRFEMYFYPSKPGNLDLGLKETWPFVKIYKNVAFIGLNSAQPRPWFVAAGRLGQTQLDNLTKALEHPEVASRFKVVVLHHHLFQVLKTPGETLRHLDDRKPFLDICLNAHVNLIVHGHNHDFTLKRVEDLIISEAGSCSVCSFKRDNRAGKFNLYTVENGILTQIETWRYKDGAYAFWKKFTPDDLDNA